jgi:formylglycine-generating enzyme required for sulfatase activity
VSGGAHRGASIEDYCLDLTEVTASAYAQCVDAGACEAASRTVWWPKIDEVERDAASELCTWGRPDRGDHPINCVTWSQARDYCRFRDARFPRDVEWTWAAIGGEDGRTYPWGEAAASATRVNACGTECRAWFERRDVSRRRVVYEADDGWAGTAAVGSYPNGRSSWGPLDLAGNVAEWTADTADAHGHRRVRGGSFWVQRSAWLTNADTAAAESSRRDAVIGFRCADDPCADDP